MSQALLDNIHSPSDLKQLEVDQLPQLCDEVREFLLDSVSKSGGHLAAGLGMVELTVALHYVYNTPSDKLIWDVGHQAYAHKILTGRKDKMHNIRQRGGISGFPKRDESEYDAFGVGHSSTSISAALGMQIASRLQGLDNHNVAIIGDGSMTAGMAYEALNDTAEVDVDLLVILNDNEMSISESVGGLSRYLARIISSKFYSQMRESSKKILANTPFLKRLARRVEEHSKGMILPSTMFEEMGFVYYGPIDGHNVIELVNTLENIKDVEEPRFMHVITEKGKGYEPAEKDPIRYHGVTPFDVASGISDNSNTAPSPPSYTEVFGQWLCDMAENDDRIIGITPAMREGSGLVEYSKRFPDRYFDVAIAEQHAVTVAAGMACEGLRPVVAIYSTFLQRGYDQMIHDVALQNLPVVFAVDRAGMVGNDGATHSGNFDYSFARCIPNMVIMAPSHEDECRQMLYTAYCLKRPCIVRYPKGKGIGKEPVKEMQALPYAEAEHIPLSADDNQQGAILLFGSLRQEAIHAAESLNYDLYNMRFIKPLDHDTLDQVMNQYQHIVTIEENAIMGGAGSGVNEYCLRQHYTGDILNIGLDDIIYPHGSRDEQLQIAGLTGPQIVNTITEHNSQAPVNKAYSAQQSLG